MTTAMAPPPRSERRTVGGPSRTEFIGPAGQSPSAWLFVVAAAAALVWTYWPTLQSLMREWRNDENYSVGQLVPFAAAYMLWQDRKRLLPLRPVVCWWGVVILLASQVMRTGGVLYLYESLERYSLVVAIWGLVLLLAGPVVFRRLTWILLFLLLMVPLPGRVHNMISGPLQDLATAGAVFSLELLGVSVSREGHVLLLNNQVPVAVAEACSGLRMLTAFVVVDAVLTYVVDRPAWQKLVMLCAAVPVAVVCNLIRLVATAMLYLAVNAELAERFFHDFAGWTMMPLAVVMLFGLLWLLNRLVLADSRDSEDS